MDQNDLSILSHHLFDIGVKFKRLLPAQPCLLCGADSREKLCCAECDAGLPHLTGTLCPTCALPSPSANVCGRCLRHPPPFKHAVAAFGYGFPLDKMIQSLKFNERLVLAEFLADALIECLTTRPDLLVALPLHPVRLRERGFNQSLLLAQRISQRLRIPLLPDACERVRDTPPQSGLPWNERDRNMRRAFICNPRYDLRGKHVAIVDDVMTTGASIGELARSLKQAGANEISAWAVARTLPHNN